MVYASTLEVKLLCQALARGNGKAIPAIFLVQKKWRLLCFLTADKEIWWPHETH
jgi:hypothetical protein